MKYLALFFCLVLISGCVSSEIEIREVSADKEVYHSAEVMNLTAEIYSSSGITNITVIASGVNNRFIEEKSMDLKQGLNKVSFTYTLPRCNVCGGISPGDYNLSFTVRYKNITVEDSTVINIQQ